MINTHAELMDAIESLIEARIRATMYGWNNHDEIGTFKSEIADFLRRQSMAVGVYANEKDREVEYYRGRPRG